MKKIKQKNLLIALFLLLAFTLWTLAIRFVDTAAVGPNGSVVGFSKINTFFHRLSGVNMTLYIITDWLGLVPIFVAFGFAVLGIIQWIKRKKLSKVDYSIFILGGFYIIVIAAYILFEMITVNYRPVLINGILETSYPSSTTLLVLSVMPTASMQFNSRIKKRSLKNAVSILIAFFISFMLLGRVLSGVHWFTDIVGGILLSGCLVMLYKYLVSLKIKAV